ncbi:MAG TPA: PfkB family carbohydrate kinase [Chitinophagaceae bacterium]|nr:PfkB family carbohydrate kinase [Chitinophagaceae bacterium]
MPYEFFDNLFSHFGNIRVAVIGDAMVDVYLWGIVERISPEAPVPVVTLQKEENRPGGAANVAANLRALGASVELYTVTGDDSTAGLLCGMLETLGISTKGVLRSKTRTTTTKSRIICRSQQMLRLDQEMTEDLIADDEIDFLNLVLSGLESNRPDVVILQDYNKGVLTSHVIQQLIAKAEVLSIPTCVDPKVRNFLAYTGATVFKPNLKEVREALNLPGLETTEESLGEVHAALSQRLGHQVTFITLSEHGVYYQDSRQGAIVPSHMRNIADVSGAGDTVIATAGLVWAATKNARLMAEIANLAGGLVCEEVGVVTVDKERLLSECRKLLR